MEGDERYGTAEIWLQMQGNRGHKENRVVLWCPVFSENKKTNIQFHFWKFIFLEH